MWREQHFNTPYGPGTNFVLDGDKFFVSFNPAALASDTTEGETALVHGNKYYILNGDFRDSYTSLVPQGLEACLRFYRQQSAHAQSTWTSPSVLCQQ